MHNCPKPDWVGDGFCDDAVNNPECEFDKNDCCLDVIINNFCTLCFCVSTNSRHISKSQKAMTTYTNEGELTKITILKRNFMY